MKTLYLIFIPIILLSCKDDISNKKFRNENYVFYKENGKTGEWLKINPELELNLPKSHSTYFFPNGNRHSELIVFDNFSNRTIIYFNKEDNLTRKTIYKSNKVDTTFYENGYCKAYHSNIGLLRYEGLVEKNKFQDIWKFYRKDGKTLEQILEYKDDTLHGIRKDYWESGELRSITANFKGKQTGETLHYFETGELEESNFQINGEYHGTMKTFYRNGTTKSIRKYWKNKLIDTCMSYYENGQLRATQIINLDTITMKSYGKQVNYYSNGALQGESKFKGNSASQTLYYKTGSVKEVSTKINDKHHGLVISYHENGSKKKEGIAVRGKYNGRFKFFDNIGKLVKTVNYDNGIPLDSIIH